MSPTPIVSLLHSSPSPLAHVNIAGRDIWIDAFARPAAGFMRRLLHTDHPLHHSPSMQDHTFLLRR